MKDTVKIMLESEGFGTQIYSKNKEILEQMDVISEDVRRLTGFTPEKVVVLNDDENVYIEFANNLERFMDDNLLDFNEALNMVMLCNNAGGYEPIIIVDESAVERIDMEALVKTVGVDHILRK